VPDDDDLPDMLPGPLIRDRKVAYLFDRVAPQLDAHRMLGSGGKDVDDAASQCELPASFDKVDSRITPQDQLGSDVVDVDVLTLGHDHRVQVSEAGYERLKYRPHGSADHAQRLAVRPMGDPAQHRHTNARGIGCRTQALMRKGLPGGEDRRTAGSELVLHGIGDVLRLARRSRDDEQESFTRGIRRNGSRDDGAYLRDSGDVHPIDTAQRLIDDRRYAGDAREGAAQALGGGFAAEPLPRAGTHAPVARSMAARSCSAKSGSPTSRSVTYGRSRLKLTGLPSTCDAVSPCAWATASGAATSHS
jgi:hypothetical protein